MIWELNKKFVVIVVCLLNFATQASNDTNIIPDVCFWTIPGIYTASIVSTAFTAGCVFYNWKKEEKIKNVIRNAINRINDGGIITYDSEKITVNSLNKNLEIIQDAKGLWQTTVGASVAACVSQSFIPIPKKEEPCGGVFVAIFKFFSTIIPSVYYWYKKINVIQNEISAYKQ